MILIIIREIYQAAELDALVNIVPVDVVVPLDAVQKGSSADQQQDATKKMIVTDTTTKERTKRVVVPLADTPQKRDCRPSPSRWTHRQQRFGGLLFQCLCAQELEWGRRNTTQQWRSSCLLDVYVCVKCSNYSTLKHTLAHNTPPFYSHLSLMQRKPLALMCINIACTKWLAMHAPNGSIATNANACMQHLSSIHNAPIYTYHY